MTQYGVAEAKNNFTHLLDRVEAGENITITRHGKPIAELRATPKARPSLTRDERLKRFDEFVAKREAQPVLDISAADLVRQMRDERW